VSFLPSLFGHIAVFSLYNLTPWWRHQMAIEVLAKTGFCVITVLIVESRMFRQMLFDPL
jgi:predicted membrane channel-forming protein YqfA (hemolysin III family)